MEGISGTEAIEIRQEGLHTYQVRKIKDNPYYMTVEYQIIKRNDLKKIIPVQLREEDGQAIVLFDITGKKSLKEKDPVEGFSFERYRKIIENILMLLDETDEYMLDPDYLCFQPEYIYYGEEGLQWIYLPEKGNGAAQDMEDFFSWLLTRADYEDARGVRFVYRVFHKIRQHGFSSKVLEKCLEPEQEVSQKEEKKQDSYEEFFEKELSDWDEPEETEEPAEQKRRRRILPIALFLLSIVSAVMLVVCYWGYQTRYPYDEMIRCMIGFGMAAIAFFMGAVFAGRYQRNEGGTKERRAEEKETREGSCRIKNQREMISEKIRKYESGREKAYEWKKENGGKEVHAAGREEPDFWEEENGTVILGVRSDDFTPVIQEKTTGIIHEMIHFPYYIGSDPESNQLIIKEETISRRHAVILREEQTGKYILRDFSSTNGTWADGKRLKKGSEIFLRDGMNLCFAKKEYQFFLNL